MSERVNPFGDLADFAPAPTKTKIEHKEVVEEVAAQHGFPSRQPVKPVAALNPTKSAQQKEQLPSRRKLTGRSEQINIKTTFLTKKRLMEISVEKDMPLGEVLELALAALEKSWE
jgi:hypothetical protein